MRCSRARSSVSTASARSRCARLPCASPYRVWSSLSPPIIPLPGSVRLPGTRRWAVPAPEVRRFRHPKWDRSGIRRGPLRPVVDAAQATAAVLAREPAEPPPGVSSRSRSCHPVRPVPPGTDTEWSPRVADVEPRPDTAADRRSRERPRTTDGLIRRFGAPGRGCTAESVRYGCPGAGAIAVENLVFARHLALPVAIPSPDPVVPTVSDFGSSLTVPSRRATTPARQACR